MSFKLPPTASERPNRSQLFVPGSKPQLFEKAAKSAADIINLDLEDSVSPDEKPHARKNIIKAINDIDWGTRILSVRINGLDTHFCYRDVIDLIEQGGDRVDLIMIPKVGTAGDMYAIDMLCTQAEDAMGRTKRLGFEIIMETAMSLANLAEIVKGSPRLQSVHFGVADYAASMGMAVTGIGGTQDDYGMLSGDGRSESRDFALNDPWHYPFVQMVAHCRAAGILPVDGPFGDFSDAEGYKAQARRAQVLGCVGKWAIHPNQVALANEVFTPSNAIVERANRILAAMKEAEAQGQGAVTLDGKLIDLASIRQAEVIVRQSEMLKAQAS